MTGTTYDGLLELQVRGREWRRRQRPPLALNMLERPRSLVAMATDQSGGLRGGDRVHTEVSVGVGAHLEWSPASSALYFPAAFESPAATEVSTHLTVASGSRLAWCPKVSIPCAGARVVQLTTIDLQSGAEFLYWDGWAAGRTHSGEHGEFHELSGVLELRLDDRAAYRERWSVTGESWHDESPASGVRGAKQWYLGLALGPESLAALKSRVAIWKDLGETAEWGQLTDELAVARVLCRVPRGQ